jgi:hypothetical protein
MQEAFTYHRSDDILVEVCEVSNSRERTVEEGPMEMQVEGAVVGLIWMMLSEWRKFD